MRPTLSEQLRGLHHILDHVIAPQVQSDYANEILLGVSRAMEMLALRAGEVGPFLVWDNHETHELLRTIATRGLALTEPLDPNAPIATGDVDADALLWWNVLANYKLAVIGLTGVAEFIDLHMDRPYNAPLSLCRIMYDLMGV